MCPTDMTSTLLQSCSWLLFPFARDLSAFSHNLTKFHFFKLQLHATADEMLLLSIALQSLGGFLFLTIAQLLWTYIKSPLKNIPGPFFAKFTNLWRFFDTYGGRPELTQRILHEKYGSVVRLGPNVVSISDPKIMRIIYNTRGDYLKVC